MVERRGRIVEQQRLVQRGKRYQSKKVRFSQFDFSLSFVLTEQIGRVSLLRWVFGSLKVYLHFSLSEKVVAMRKRAVVGWEGKGS